LTFCCVASSKLQVMEFAMPRSSRSRIYDLVVTLDADDQPIAATWRLVNESAAKLGLPRPSYPHVRRLVLAARRHRQLRRELHDVLQQAATTFAAGRVPGFDYTLGRLLDAQRALAADEACVSETQGFLSGTQGPPG
jgi:hypothetical protein